MDLTRSGGPGDRPPIDPEQQRQLDLQRELERQKEQELQRPVIAAQLEAHIDQRPDLQNYLKQFKPEEQYKLKQAMTDSVARFGSYAKQIDHVQIGKQDGKLYVLSSKYFTSIADPARVLGISEEERFNLSRPNRQESVAERAGAPTLPHELQPPAKDAALTLEREQAADNRQQHVERESGQSRPQPARLPQEMMPQQGPHLAQRLNDISQQIEQHLGDQLKHYSPAQQQALAQALSQEVSDFAGWEPQIRQVNRDENGLLHVLYNKTGEITLDPQQVLQPERQQDIPREPLSLEAQQAQDTQRQLREQADQLTQLNPIERMTLESRLREAVGDERIESLRLEGEDTFRIGLSNGLLLTATTGELLSMDSGRELLQRAQVDPAGVNQQSDSGLYGENSLELHISREPLAYTVQTGDGLERIGHRLSAEHPDAAAWYVLQDLQERYGEKGAGSVHYNPQRNRITVHPGQHGEIDLSQRSEQELAVAGRQFRRYIGKESAEDIRREAVRQENERRLQTQREQQSSDQSYLQFSLQYIADQRQLDPNTPQNRITYEQKPINYYATNLHAMGLDPASEDAYISRRNKEGGWTGVTAGVLTAKRTFYESWNILTLGAVKAQDELVLQHNHNLITDEQYNRGTLWNAGSKTAMVVAGGWMARAGGAQTLELKALTQSVKTPWPYVGATVSGVSDAGWQYYSTGDIRLKQVAVASGTGFLLTPYAMRANIAGNGIIGATNGLANASFQNAYYGDQSDLAGSMKWGGILGASGAKTGSHFQQAISPHSSQVAALLQPIYDKTPGYVMGNISSMLISSTPNPLGTSSPKE